MGHVPPPAPASFHISFSAVGLQREVRVAKMRDKNVFFFSTVKVENAKAVSGASVSSILYHATGIDSRSLKSGIG